MYKAEVIADSYNKHSRITTMEVVMPRIILAEMNTHRMFSRNSASSRAIPSEKMIKSIQENPFVPLMWMKNHKGMQGKEYFDHIKSGFLDNTWKRLSKEAISNIERLSFEGEEVTKQITNRLLEPFMFHKAVITTNEFGFENFISQRLSEEAEIHMKHVASLMLESYNNSEAKKLDELDYHIPYLDNINSDILKSILFENYKDALMSTEQWSSEFKKLKVKISVARLARTSYTEVGEKSEKNTEKEQYIKDIALHDKLIEQGHWSPFEHIAYSSENRFQMGGNLGIGWVQYRKLFTNEMKRDSRVIHKHKKPKFTSSLL
jgi:thymidylate synthase ThyX